MPSPAPAYDLSLSNCIPFSDNISTPVSFLTTNFQPFLLCVFQGDLFYGTETGEAILGPSSPCILRPYCSSLPIANTWKSTLSFSLALNVFQISDHDHESRTDEDSGIGMISLIHRT